MTEIITEKTLAEYESFVQGHPKGNFAQSALWAKQKPAWSWRAIARRGENGAITGTIAFLIRKMPIVRKNMLYACRGPVCDLDDRETFLELLSASKALAKELGAYVIKIDPDVPAENTAFRALLEESGFRSKSDGKNFEAIQPKFVFRLPIAGRTQEEMLAFFQQKTRYNIRLAVKKGVEVRICGKEMIPDFARLMLETGVRDGFGTRPPAYFSSMLENLGDHARLYMAFHEETPIAGTLAIHYGDKVWYLYGASSNEHRNLMPNYLLQWNMIQWAIETGSRVYDFRGVSGDLSEDNPLYGLYKFKRGFNGDFTEFVGEYDLVLKKFAYQLAEKGSAMYKKLHAKLYLLKNRCKVKKG
ncbi:MAG: peptidoglycan bridge formation glycyltransferase FemA/FemB family protein [Oscillospiraceae bacterium]|jgi:lipid II:glycine glycyltransferase (peptidoglycan interpeptide bridge formation enzyme)|nr:peptidoglycan bridge formation glycyltransferase FemA/FemB family protein [Oscillospiraceae bacterium]